MKIILAVVLAVLMITPVFAQATPQVVKTNHENGSLKSKEFQLNGTRVGVYKEYYADKKMKIKAVYNMAGELNGPMRYHDTSGRVTKKEFYENGTLVNTIEYDANGQEIN